MVPRGEAPWPRNGGGRQAPSGAGSANTPPTPVERKIRQWASRPQPSSSAEKQRLERAISQFHGLPADYLARPATQRARSERQRTRESAEATPRGQTAQRSHSSHFERSAATGEDEDECLAVVTVPSGGSRESPFRAKYLHAAERARAGPSKGWVSTEEAAVVRGGSRHSSAKRKGPSPAPSSLVLARQQMLAQKGQERQKPGGAEEKQQPQHPQQHRQPEKDQRPQQEQQPPLPLPPPPPQPQPQPKPQQTPQGVSRLRLNTEEHRRNQDDWLERQASPHKDDWTEKKESASPGEHSPRGGAVQLNKEVRSHDVILKETVSLRRERLLIREQLVTARQVQETPLSDVGAEDTDAMIEKRPQAHERSQQEFKDTGEPPQPRSEFSARAAAMREKRMSSPTGESRRSEGRETPVEARDQQSERQQRGAAAGFWSGPADTSSNNGVTRSPKLSLPRGESSLTPREAAATQRPRRRTDEDRRSSAPSQDTSHSPPHSTPPWAGAAAQQSQASPRHGAGRGRRQCQEPIYTSEHPRSEQQPVPLPSLPACYSAAVPALPVRERLRSSSGRSSTGTSSPAAGACSPTAGPRPAAVGARAGRRAFLCVETCRKAAPLRRKYHVALVL